MGQAVFIESIKEKYARLEREINGFSNSTEALFKAYCLVTQVEDQVDSLAIEAELLKNVEKDLWAFIQKS